MTTRTNLHWLPGTCACEIEFEFDKDTAWQNLTVIASRRDRNGELRETKLCSLHAGVNMANLHGVIWEEHQIKENARAQLQKVNQLVQTYTNGDGTTYIDFKPGISFQVSFTGSDASRVCEITMLGVTVDSLTKTAVKNALKLLKPGWDARCVIK